MNGLFITVVVIFLICIGVGYYRGFLKIAASLAATVATIVLVTILTPYVSNALLAMFPIENMVQEKCTELFLPEQEADESAGMTLLEGAEGSRESQISLIESAQMPDMFKQLLLENNNEEIYKSLGVTKFSEYVGSYLARLIANIASFLLVLIIVTIAVRVAIYTLGIIEKLPVIGGLNRVGGGLVGLATGLIVVWLLFVIITLMYDTEIGKTCFTHITENKALTFLYNNNILMNFLTKFRG